MRLVIQIPPLGVLPIHSFSITKLNKRLQTRHQAQCRAWEEGGYTKIRKTYHTPSSSLVDYLWKKLALKKRLMATSIWKNIIPHWSPAEEACPWELHASLLNIRHPRITSFQCERNRPSKQKNTTWRTRNVYRKKVPKTIINILTKKKLYP